MTKPSDPSLGDAKTRLSPSRARSDLEESQSIGDNSTLVGGLTSDTGDLNDALEVTDLSSRYAIIETLGQGGMGEVLLAIDKRLKRRVAIKRIRSEYAHSRSAVQRFLTEAQAIAALNHPNIVQVYDYGRDQEGPFLIMEFIDGQPLLKRCNGEALPVQQAVDLTCDLLHGLGRAHDLGIIHRDIKPANILLTKDGRPKLTDFGLAKQTTAAQGQTITGAVLGTIDFMPPEQRKDAALTDARSDLWSLAATLYQMVTGKSPKVIRLDLVPQQLTATLTKGLEDEPEERFQSSAEFRDALRRALQTAPTHQTDEIIVGQCPQCGTKNEGLVRFCRECSAPLKVPCLNCDAEIPIWDKGCTECGARQAELLAKRRAELQKLQSETERLIQAGRYKAASQVVESVGSLNHPRLVDFRQWLEEVVPDLKENTTRLEEQSKSALAEAVAHRAAWDYPAAVRTIQSLPPEAIGQEHRHLVEQLQRDWNESQQALQEIQRRLKTRELDGLLPLVRRTAALRGDREDLKKLLVQLEQREEKLVVAPRPSPPPYPSTSSQPLESIALPDFVGVASAPIAKPARNIYKDAAIGAGILALIVGLLMFLRGGSKQEPVPTPSARSSATSSMPNETATTASKTPPKSNPPVTNSQSPPTNIDLPPTNLTDTITNSIGMKLKLIPSGKFLMGAPESEEGRSANETQHTVTLTDPFYMGVYEVTQQQYEKVMGNNPSGFKHAQNPVEQILWSDAVDFCKKLSDLPAEKGAGRVYRLPTEAEWEYACRAGSTTAFSFGDQGTQLVLYGWCAENSGGKPHAVGQLLPNRWGLYDMHGNVWEWCSDWHADYSNQALTNPTGPFSGNQRVNRGGSWRNSPALVCRSARRLRDFPIARDINIGFRVVATIRNIAFEGKPQVSSREPTIESKGQPMRDSDPHSNRIIASNLDYVSHLELSPDEKRIYAGSNAKKVYCYDIADQPRLRWQDASLENHIVGLRIAPDGKTLAAASYGKYAVYQADDGKFRVKGNLPVFQGFSFSSLAFSPDLSEGILNGSGKSKRFRLKDGLTLSRQDGWYPDVVYTRDGKSFFLGCNEGGFPIEQLRPNSGKFDVIGTYRGMQDRCFSMDVSPDGRFLAASSGPAKNGKPAMNALVFDIQSKKKLFELPSNENYVHVIKFSPDNRFIATAGGGIEGDWYGHSAKSSNVIRIWSAKDQTLVQVLKGHQASVLEVEFSRDSSKLYSGSSDGTIREWKLSLR